MKQYITLIAFLLFSTSIFAQTPILNEKFDAFSGFDASQIKANHSYARGDINDALNEVFDSLSEISTISGFNAAVSLPDGSVWTRASGLAAELPVEKPMTTDAHIPMGSITKTFIAATMLLMEEDGLLSMDDSIGQYITAYPNIDLGVTITELLSHTSGFSDYLNENPTATNDWAFAQDSIWTIDDILNTYVLEPNFEPSTSWSYSNTNFLLAGKIIENITDLPWYDVVRARVSDPLGLDITYAMPFEMGDPELVPNVFGDLDGDGTSEDATTVITTMDGLMSLASSAGCLVSTPTELNTFVRATFGGELLSQASLDKMTVNYQPNPAFGIDYGLGALSLNIGLPNWGHNGSVVHQSTALYFPSSDIAISVQQNEARQGQGIVDLNDMLLALLGTYLSCDGPSDIEDVAFVDVAIYPNPASDFITFEIEESADLPASGSLLNQNGQIVKTFPIQSNKGQIDVSNYTPGVYLLKIGEGYTKVVVQ